MIAGMTLYEIMWYFLIYSFVGWIVEVAYHGAGAGVIVNRGFLNGPVCPVYGFGVISVLMLIGVLPGDAGNKTGPENLLLIFLIGVIFATAVELVAGWALDMLFHARWWDYSDRPLNLHGYICLEFSLIWGLGITFIVRIWHAEVTASVMKLLQPSWGWPLVIACFAVYAADFVISAAITAGLNKELESLDRARAAMRVVSDGLSERIGSDSMRTMQMLEEGQVQAALGKAQLRQAAAEKKEELSSAFEERKEVLSSVILEKREEFTAALTKDELEKQIEMLHKRLSSGQAARILKAFPNMKHREHNQTLEELKKRVKDARRGRSGK